MGLRFQMQINALPLALLCDSDGLIAICPMQKLEKNTLQDFGVDDRLPAMFSEAGFEIGEEKYLYNTLYNLSSSDNLRAWLANEKLAMPVLQ